MINTFFNRQIIFDHMPKTAGVSLNKWFTALLGNRYVSPNLTGGYQDLLIQYSYFKVICGHFHFFDNENLDTRYTHITVLRNPIDRILSWMDFAFHDIPSHDIQHITLKKSIQRFFQSDGQDITGELLQDNISNLYTRHFSKIKTNDILNRNDLFTKACYGLSQFTHIGFFENLNNFIEQLSQDIFSLEKTPKLPFLNITSKKTKVNELSPNVRKVLESLNQDDIKLYNFAQQITTQRRNDSNIDLKLPALPYQWIKDDRPLFVNENPENLDIEVLASKDKFVGSGEWIELSFLFSIHCTIKKLSIGIHIYDESHRWIYGTNNDLMKHELGSIQPGKHQFSFHVQLNLFPNTYIYGFSIYDSSLNPPKMLAHWQENGKINVYSKNTLSFGGLVELPTKLGNLIPNIK